MPEEIFVLLLMLILSMFGVTVTSMILRHRRKLRAGTQSSGTSMTTSELERIMRHAVQEATLPLATKIEGLEMELSHLATVRGHLGAPEASRQALTNAEGPSESGSMTTTATYRT
jgi:hypothetical protein